MTRTCDYCGETYSRSPSLIGRFCSAECGRAGRRKAGTDRKHRRIRNQKGHPLAGPTGLVAEARAVLYDTVGPGPHPCHWCGKIITWSVGKSGNLRGHIVADHLDGDPLNDALSNLVPSCGPCNGTRGVKISDDEAYRLRATGTRLRGSPRICEACGADFVAWETRPGKGRFCSRSCARKAPRRKAIDDVA